MITSDSALNELVKARVKKLRLHRGWLRWLAWRIRLWFFRGPRAEIAHEVQVVQSFAKRALECLQTRVAPSGTKEGQTEPGQPKTPAPEAGTEAEITAAEAERTAVEARRTAVTAARTETEGDKAAAVVAKAKADAAKAAAEAATRKAEAAKAAAGAAKGEAEDAKACDVSALESKLIDVLALLECAKTESDFAQAWTYVNLADAILTLVVAENELTACVSRLATADRRLPEEYHDQVPRQPTPAEVVTLLQAVQALMARHQLAPSETEVADLQKQIEKMLKPSLSAKKRNEHHADQLVRTFLWNGVNRKISLKLALWASIRRRLLFALLAFFAALALLIYSGEKHASWNDLASFVAIGLLGLFGGMLSAFLRARDEDVNVPSYQVVLSRTSLRMLLGAAGAIVMYSVGLLLLSDQLQTLINNNLFAFMTVGIVAGFSERLFIDTLVKAASNLHTTGSPTKEEEKKSSPSPKDSTATKNSSDGQSNDEADAS